MLVEALITPQLITPQLRPIADGDQHPGAGRRVAAEHLEWALEDLEPAL